MDLAEIHFTVGDDRYDFTPPTAGLAFKASRLFGGVGVLADRCQAGDLDVYAAVLKLACPKAAALKEAAREAFIFANLLEVNTACTRWAIALQWGGREPHQVRDAQEQAGEAPSEETPGGNGEPGPAAESR